MRPTEQELTRLLKANQEKYYRMAHTYVKNREDALDIVHDAIVKALQKVHQVNNPMYLETWFCRILINQSLSFVRRRKNALNLEEVKPISREEDWTGRVSLYDAIDRLPPKLKTVILLRFFEDRSFEEIARITALKESTVKARVYKALQLLKLDMEDVDI